MNSGIIDMLKTIARMRLCENTERGRWSSKQHLEASKIISNCKEEIKSIDQIKNILGPAITLKIEEYLKTGTLAELEQNSALIEKSNIINTFSSIPGVGFAVGKKWYEQGYKSKEDIEKAVKLGHIKLNRMQLIGLKYLDEISQKMTRNQMEAISNYIEKSLKNIEPDFNLKIVGSYRRGVSKSKDVDIIIYPNSTDIGIDGVMEDLLKEIRDQTIIFIQGDSHFMGLVEYDGILRRVDIWIVHMSELITTLVGRTSYVETNKKLRLTASKKGYKVSNHGIYKNGQQIVFKSENEIFEMFGIEKDYSENFSL